jgi:hypothetical protein
MLGILLDAGAIMAIIYVVNQGDEIDFGPAIFAAAIITIASFACGLLWPSIGWLSIVPVIIVAVVTIGTVSGLTLNRALAAGGMFTAYKIAITFAFVSLMA